MRYTRDELEALSGAASSEAQALRWSEVLAALATAGFSGDYDGLLATDELVNSRGRKASGGGRKASAPNFSGMSHPPPGRRALVDVSRVGRAFLGLFVQVVTVHLASV